MRGQLHEIGDIARMLAGRIQHLAPELLPGGRRQGSEWVAGGLDGGKGRSLSVCLVGAKAGVWADFAGGARGDALDLVAQARFGGNRGEALKWARAWLGLGGVAPEGRQAAAVVRPRDTAAEAREAKQRRAKGLALYLKGVGIEGTPAEAYLAGRGITLVGLGARPSGLRFHGATWCSERQGEHPAMLAPILRYGPQGSLQIGVHRTYLGPDGRGGWGKARIEKAKKVLGGQQGGCIPLWRGASGKAMQAAPEGDVVAIAEGIEDALTVALSCPEWRCIACVNIGNMAEISLPPAVAEVVLVLDRDGENPACRQARERAKRRYLGEGRAVRQALPGEGFKDFNAELMAAMPRRGAA
jgi:hypothetical protein